MVKAMMMAGHVMEMFPFYKQTSKGWKHEITLLMRLDVNIGIH